MFTRSMCFQNLLAVLFTFIKGRNDLKMKFYADENEIMDCEFGFNQNDQMDIDLNESVETDQIEHDESEEADNVTKSEENENDENYENAENFENDADVNENDDIDKNDENKSETAVRG